MVPVLLMGREEHIIEASQRCTNGSMQGSNHIRRRRQCKDPFRCYRGTCKVPTKIVEEQESIGKEFMPATAYKRSLSTDIQTHAKDPHKHSEQQFDALAVPPHSEFVTELSSSSLPSNLQLLVCSIVRQENFQRKARTLNLCAYIKDGTTIINK
ncbi:hypothetical protein C5167_046771 [Papaver somniferum]|uniref:Uncharacterized protein n=1 Tax=Papaver somniferum TaxID=3469 RepID=A0A4Y7LER6_PAPSO|nr:hypothetical protein C5167_046771 [Papaver somniferum]